MRESIIALLYMFCLFISFRSWYLPLLHKYENQRELIEQLREEIKELKEDIYINK